MHILMVAPQPFFRPRGTPFSVLHRIRALTKLGHTVELATYPFGESPDIPGLRIHRSPRPPLVHDVRIGPSLAKVFLDAPLFRLADRLAASGRFDLLHTHEEAGWIGQRLRRRYGLPHLYDMHSSLPQQLANFGRYNLAPFVAVFRRLEQRTLDSADAVIAICPELHDHVVAAGYAGPLATIENTLDIDIPAPEPDEDVKLRRELDLGDAAVVVYTGTTEAYQGLDLLVAAAPQVREICPHVRFVIVGGDAEGTRALRERTRQHDVEALFRFVPTVPPADVFRYHRLADALVTTRSRGTNTPLKIYQYLRANRPIVATAIRSHTQVLDAESAELVAPDPAAIAHGLVRVLTDPAHARSLADAAGRLAHGRYSATAYMKTLEALLARIPRRPASAQRRQ
jgi:glycosyltransferase involved in cell wall biosynthesis